MNQHFHGLSQGTAPCLPLPLLSRLRDPRLVHGDDRFRRPRQRHCLQEGMAVRIGGPRLVLTSVGLFRQSTLFNFGKGIVAVAVIGPEPTKDSMHERDMQALGALIVSAGVDGVVVGLGVQRAQDWRLLARNAHHLSAKRSDLLDGRLGHFFEIRKQTVVVSLQALVRSSETCKIEGQLQGADNGHSSPHHHLVYAVASKEVAHSGGTKGDYQEIENPAPALERQPPRCVVESVSQDIEAQVFKLFGHFFLLGGGLGRVGGAAGCLGPGPAPTPLPGGLIAVIVGAGWRTPALLISHFDKVVSIWFCKWGWKAPVRFGERIGVAYFNATQRCASADLQVKRIAHANQYDCVEARA